MPDRCIRPETPRDLAEIRSVHLAAFGGPDEARIVDALREAGALSVSLVMVEGEQIVGHIAFSPVTVDGRAIGVGLAPVGVLPTHQRRGVGNALCREGLAAARSGARARACVVLGHAAYYPRFGFKHASTWGLSWEGGHDESFFAMELVEGAFANVRGVVRYHPAVA